MRQASFKVGLAKITPIFEIAASTVIQDIIPQATKEAVLKIDWLQPYFVDQSGNLKAQVQAFVIESDGKSILIDACVGNNKPRPAWPEWSNLQTDFLANLAVAGYKPAAIDIVVCTHLHYDHVGWNTKQIDGMWVPTFPNARYLVVEEEYTYWSAQPAAEMQDDLNGIADSVMPVVEAGLVDFVAEDYQITAELSLFPTPGHTPHHVCVLVESAGQSAVITGDVLHHPCQIAHPEWMSYDTDKKQALATRLAFLNRFADTETFVIGSHFAAPAIGTIQKDRHGFKFSVATGDS